MLISNSSKEFAQEEKSTQTEKNLTIDTLFKIKSNKYDNNYDIMNSINNSNN